MTPAGQESRCFVGDRLYDYHTREAAAALAAPVVARRRGTVGGAREMAASAKVMGSRARG